MEKGDFFFFLLATASVSDKGGIGKTGGNYSSKLNKTLKCFPKDLKHYRVQITSELWEQTQSITKSYWPSKYAYSGFKYMSLLCCLTTKCLTYQCSPPLPLQPIIKKWSHKSIEWTEPDARPQWCTSGWLPFVQWWIFPRILLHWKYQLTKLGKWSHWALFGHRKERNTSLSIEQDHIDSQHKTVFFFSCLHNNNMFAYRTAFALLLYL